MRCWLQYFAQYLVLYKFIHSFILVTPVSRDRLDSTLQKPLQQQVLKIDWSFRVDRVG